MKKIFAILLFTANSLACHAQFGAPAFRPPVFNPALNNAGMYGNLSNASVTQNFSALKLKEFTHEHQTVAIVPFAVRIEYKEMPEGNTVEATEEEEKADRKDFQQELAIALRDRARKHPFSVTFQQPDIEDNPALVDTFQRKSIDSTLIVSLCKSLKVDAIVVGTAVVTPNKKKRLAFHLRGRSAAGSAVVKIKLYDGKTGTLLWFSTVDIYIQPNTEWLDIVESGMNKIAKKFPYQGK